MMELASQRRAYSLQSFCTVRNVLIIIIPLLATVVVLWKFFLVVQVPFRLDYAEGFIFTNTLSLFHGSSMYQSVETLPYIFGFYTPLFNYLGSLCFTLFGTSIAVLRTLSLLSYLVTGFAVAYVVQRMTQNFFAAVYAALLLYSAFIVSQWSSVARPDMLGLCLVALGIAVVFAKRGKHTPRMLLVAFLFALAFFAKQSFIFAPLAYFLYLLFEKRNDAWRFAGAYATFVGLGILALHVSTQGEFTKQIFVYTGYVPYGNLYAAFRIAALTGIAALPFILFAFVRAWKNPKHFLSLYFICSLLTFPMLFREGGIQNYLLEFVLALVLLVSTSIPWQSARTLPKRIFYPSLLVLSCFLGLWSLAALPWETQTYVDARREVFHREVAMIEPGTKVLVEDPLIAHAVGATVDIDPFTFGQIADSGRLATDELFSAISKGTYAFVDDYGAFKRIPGFLPLINEHFQAKIPLHFSKPVKPFDFSIYNRNTFTSVGTMYVFDAGVRAK